MFGIVFFLTFVFFVRIYLYFRKTNYQLFVSNFKPQLVTKSFDSFLEKSFRKNIIYNKKFPEPPYPTWITPDNWIENTNDILRTFCEHIAVQISKALAHQTKGKILVTGGGVYNSFLIDCIKSHTIHQLIIPDKKVIEFKEALLFAFLGVLRIRNEINCLKSVTGAEHDNCGGNIYYFTS